MVPDLRWLVSQSASCLHAIEATRRGITLTEPHIAAALAEPGERLIREARSHGLDDDRFWEHLVPLAADIDNNRQLAEVAVRKTLGTSDRARAAIDPLAGRIGEVEEAVRRALPDLLDEVAATAEPLRRAWEPQVALLLQGVARLTDERLVVPAAKVILVHPATGGGGAAHLMYNSATIEALAVDPVPQLPELLRLTWLLAQLNIDLPVFSERIHAHRRPLIAALAMLPVTLAAAEGINVVRCDRPTIDLAISAWRVSGPPNVDLGEALSAWWQSYVESPPAWHVALMALDQMIA